MASSAEPCSDEAIGSSVNSRFSQAPAIVSSPRRLVVIASMPSLTVAWAAAASALASSIASPSPLIRSRDDVGVLVEELRGDDQVRRHELAVGPQVGLVDEHVAAALVDEPGRPRLGHPGAVDGRRPGTRSACRRSPAA